MKICSKCKVPKSLEMFGKNRSRKDKLAHRCKVCRSIHDVNYRKPWSPCKGTCLQCAEIFIGVAGKKYCSGKCRKQAHRQSPAYKAQVKAYKQTQSYRDTLKRRRLRPEYKESKRLAKRIRRKEYAKRRLNVPWSDIAAFYKGARGKHVDHIIPLNHPNVCGLHIPNNFQYLSPEENMKKNNKFDGTYENESWKDD